MTKRIGFLSIAVFLMLASVGFAQTLTFTGVGNGSAIVNAGGESVYADPYTGTINGTPSFIICDDFVDEVGSTWSASEENASSVDPNVRFFGANYSELAYLANLLMADYIANPSDAFDEEAISLAIWNITDPGLAATDVSQPTVVAQAAADTTAAAFFVAHGYTGSDVDVYTPCATGSNGNQNHSAACPGANPYTSQEFLWVDGPPNVPAPEPASAAILGFDLLSALAGVCLVLRYRARRA
jgi:hypothetical protein